MPPEIVPAVPAHILAMSGRLRAGDAAEIEAAGITARRALWRSYRHSLTARAALLDGEVAAVWGLAGPALGRIGNPWLLTSPAVERVKVAFVREARREVARMIAFFPELRGMVDARYARAIRFLGAIGFDVGPEQPWGFRGAPFREFRLVRQEGSD